MRSQTAWEAASQNSVALDRKILPWHTETAIRTGPAWKALRPRTSGGFTPAFWPLVNRALRGVAQPGSALALGARGPRFESARPDHLSIT